jgi:hypothetical protein
MSTALPALEAQIAEAVAELNEQLEQHPERRLDVAREAVLQGEPRPYPVFYLGRNADTEAGEGVHHVAPPQRTPEEEVLEGVRGITAPLAMLNPIAPAVGFPRGNNPMAASFGVPLNPELNFTPMGWRTLDEVLAEGMPDPETSGILAEMHAFIDAAKALLPAWIKILPQPNHGPFNTAHMILGDEAFTAMYEEPEKYADFMAIVAEFLLAVHMNMRQWIGPERFPLFPTERWHFGECSVNMVSQAAYMEHIFPHDLHIAEVLGEMAIHPCSGPHVFYATLRNLPNVVYTEAGTIYEPTAAGSISVDDAQAEIGDRPIMLSIGEELRPGEEEETIRRHFDRARSNPRLLFSFTGMHWRKKDEPMMREMHLRLDDYWHEHVWQGG